MLAAVVRGHYSLTKMGLVWRCETLVPSSVKMAAHGVDSACLCQLSFVREAPALLAESMSGFVPSLRLLPHSFTAANGWVLLFQMSLAWDRMCVVTRVRETHSSWLSLSLSLSLSHTHTHTNM